ncbi:hypothetical protein ACWD0A_24985 [Streptomyces sp. NPDC002867]
MTDQLDLTDLATAVPPQRGHLVFATVSGAHLYGFPSRSRTTCVLRRVRRGTEGAPLAGALAARRAEETH